MCGLFIGMSDVIRHIGKDVKLGENVPIWSFSYIGNGAVIGGITRRSGPWFTLIRG